MKKKNSNVFKYEVLIEIDEDNVDKKYPNYGINYDNPKELADAIAFGVAREGETDMAKDGWKEWGYSIKVKEVDVF
jgi:hypothetical protein